eukprot:scaffold15707_cov63-Phaeocystis_antarctica.AAC.3
MYTSTCTCRHRHTPQAPSESRDTRTPPVNSLRAPLQALMSMLPSSLQRPCRPQRRSAAGAAAPQRERQSAGYSADGSADCSAGCSAGSKGSRREAGEAPAGGEGKLLAHEQQLANVDILGAGFVVFWFCLWRDVLGEVVVHALENSFHCAIGVGEGKGKEPVGGDVAVDLIPDGLVYLRVADLAIEVHVLARGELHWDARPDCVETLNHTEGNRGFAARLHLREHFAVLPHIVDGLMQVLAANLVDLHEVERVNNCLQIQYGTAVHVRARPELEPVAERLQEGGDERKASHDSYKEHLVTRIDQVGRGQEGKGTANHGQRSTGQEEEPEVPESEVLHR